MIYDYENKVKEITKFLGFTEKEHINKKTRFNPDISIIDFCFCRPLYLIGFSNAISVIVLINRVKIGYNAFSSNNCFL